MLLCQSCSSTLMSEIAYSNVPPSPVPVPDTDVLPLEWADPMGLYRFRFMYRNAKFCADKEWWDDIIYAGQCFQDPVHTEVVLPDGRIYTATTDNGVCFVQRDYGSYPADIWEYEDVWVPRQAAVAGMKRAIFNIMEKEAHNYQFPKERPWGYDWGAIFMFGKVPFVHPSENDWFCSETSADLAVTIKVVNLQPEQLVIKPCDFRRLSKVYQP